MAETAAESVKDKKEEESQGTGFARRTDFKWLALGIAVFILIVVVIPMPESMMSKAQTLFSELTPEAQAKTSPEIMAEHIKVIIALLGMCVVFLAISESLN